MNRSIVVFGLASQKQIKTIPLPKNLPSDISLMDFLIENGITIASSCAGVGSCKKCVANSEILTCQIKLKDFVSDNIQSRVEISYL